jgi:hypothetical protein
MVVGTDFGITSSGTVYTNDCYISGGEISNCAISNCTIDNTNLVDYANSAGYATSAGSADTAASASSAAHATSANYATSAETAEDAKTAEEAAKVDAYGYDGSFYFLYANAYGLNFKKQNYYNDDSSTIREIVDINSYSIDFSRKKQFVDSPIKASIYLNDGGFCVNAGDAEGHLTGTWTS